MKLIDLHEDFGYSASAGKDVINGNYQSSIKLLSEFDEALIFASIFPHVDAVNERSEMLTKAYGSYTPGTFFSFDLLVNQVKMYLYLERSGYVKVVRNLNDLNDSRKLKFLMSLEGTDVLKDYTDLYVLKDLGIRNLGLTWNYDTKFASSCMSKKDYGLTGEGEDLVRLANQLSIIIDLAHASKRTIIDVASISKKPIIVSHGNVNKLKDHKRNLDDEAIEAIVKTDGVIGVTAIVSTLPKPDIGGMVEVIKYIGESFGWRYVALGTDFLGINETPKGFEDVTKVKELANEIEGHVDEVLWDNAMRVIKANLSLS
ncbi:MAG: membrane dipeptidase [Sulfolobaceae archaeon]|nr:membrane dipeptidase [Sulfolobaceae archaeon]